MMKIEVRIAILLKINVEATILDKTTRAEEIFFPNYSPRRNSWKEILEDLNLFKF